MALGGNSNLSSKHAIIDKNNSRIVITISLAVFIVVFSLFALKALVSQSTYHQRVIKDKEVALKVLKENKIAAKDLELSYESFVGEPINVIGGNPRGTGPRDGDNAKLVLDSLPSKYDFPALSSSIEKILLDGGFQIKSVGGDEDATLQENNASSEELSTKPVPVEIPYPFSVQTDVASAVRLLSILEKSIRPFSVNSITLTGQQDSIKLDIDLNTYYQPASGLIINTKEVK